MPWRRTADGLQRTQILYIHLDIVNDVGCDDDQRDEQDETGHGAHNGGADHLGAEIVEDGGNSGIYLPMLYRTDEIDVGKPPPGPWPGAGWSGQSRSFFP